MALIQQKHAETEVQPMPISAERTVENSNLMDRARERLSNLAFGWTASDAASRSVILRRLNWMVPTFLFLLVAGYQLGPARWIHTYLGHHYHLAAEIIVYGTAGPLLALGFINLFRRWLEERDTSDLQSQLLENARAEAERSRELNDDALQVLFAAGAMLDTLKAAHPAYDDALLEEIDTTEEALQAAVHQLRSRLLQADLPAGGTAGGEQPQ